MSTQKLGSKGIKQSQKQQQFIKNVTQKEYYRVVADDLMKPSTKLSQ